MKHKIIFYFPLVICINIIGLSFGSTSIVGYDCVNLNTDVVPLSLSETQTCNRVSNQVNMTQTTIQLVSKKAYDNIPVIGCLVQYSTMAYHCDKHSHISIVQGGYEDSQIYTISRDECMQLHNTGTVTIMNTFLTGNKINSITSHQVNEVGSIDTDGTCQGQSSSYMGVDYANLIVKRSYQIKLWASTVKIDIDGSKIIMESGYRYDHSLGHAFDPDVGHLFWNPSLSETCKANSFVVLYEGPAYLYKSQIYNMEMILINGTLKAFVLPILQETNVCMMQGFTTKHPTLFIIKSDSRLGFYLHQEIGEPRLDISVYINSKFVLMKNHLGMALSRLRQEMEYQLCILRQKDFRTISNLAFTNPEEFAWSYQRKPGVSAILKGDVIYMIRCSPVSVKIRSTTDCYDGIPVSLNGTNMFMKAISRILIDHATRSPCNPIAPPMFHLNNQWIKFSPHAELAAPPMNFNPEVKFQWENTPIQGLKVAGVYSKDQLQKYLKQIIFPLKSAVLLNDFSQRLNNIVLHKTEKATDYSSKLLAVFSYATETTWWSWLKVLGIHFSSILFTLWVIRLIKSIIYFLLNFQLIKQAGCKGVKYFKAFSTAKTSEI